MVIDPFQPYATAARAELADARVVVDHFHVIRLANQALDEIRRRTRPQTLGHRDRNSDPLYRIRRRLLAGHERLSAEAFALVLHWLAVGDPAREVAPPTWPESCCARCSPPATSSSPAAGP